jgi:hypothetical protein
MTVLTAGWSITQRSANWVVRDDSDVGMAASLFSRVLDVLAADPGIVTIMDLGPARRRAHAVAT